MNSTVNYRYIINTVVLLIALLCLALWVRVLQSHESANAVHLVKHGIMIIQTHARSI
jgi:hypothetical protein